MGGERVGEGVRAEGGRVVTSSPLLSPPLSPSHTPHPLTWENGGGHFHRIGTADALDAIPRHPQRNATAAEHRHWVRQMELVAGIATAVVMATGGQ